MPPLPIRARKGAGAGVVCRQSGSGGTEDVLGSQGAFTGGGQTGEGLTLAVHVEVGGSTAPRAIDTTNGQDRGRGQGVGDSEPHFHLRINPLIRS